MFQKSTKKQSEIRSLLLTAMVLMLSLAFMPAWGQTTTQKFNSSETWTVPVGVTEVTIEVIGAGGGGGGAQAGATFNTNSIVGGGGGGGAYATITKACSPGQQFVITVGTGGAGGTCTGLAITGYKLTDGTAGGASSVRLSSDTSAFIVANGGQGGKSANVHLDSYTGVGGAGGSFENLTGVTGNNGANGGNASRGFNSGSIYPWAVSGAGGNAGAYGTCSYSGAGGAALNDNGASNKGGNYGGGGSGANQATVTNDGRVGGQGADGIVVISYVTPPSSINVTFNANTPQNDNNMNAAIPGNTNILINTAYGSALDWRDASYKTARKGYTFTGWNTAADGTGTNITATSIAGTSDVTLYAQWSTGTYSIIFEKFKKAFKYVYLFCRK